MDRWVARASIARRCRCSAEELLKASELAHEAKLVKLADQLLDLAVEVGKVQLLALELPSERARREEEDDCPAH